jgi:hypothetical protein
MIGVPFYPEIFYPKTCVLSNWMSGARRMPPGPKSLPVAAYGTPNPNQMCFHVERTRGGQRAREQHLPPRLTQTMDVD